MRLTLSSAAAPDADLEELAAACARRGLAAIELCAGDAHGMDVEHGALDRIAAVSRAAAAGIGISAYRTGAYHETDRLIRMSAALGVPILLDPAAGTLTDCIRAAARLRRAGAQVAIVVRGAAAVRDAADVAAAELGVAWDADPANVPVAQHAEALMEDCAAALRHVRLIGGGPEVALREGMGVGALMARLALARFDGDLVLAPSSPRYRVAWQTWLGRRGGWGCGSKAEGAVLPLAGARPTAGAGR
jgi:hypothetical protein